MKFQFDNSNVQVVLSPISDNYGTGWEESSVCYPTTEGWEFVVGFEIPDKWGDVPVEEWRVNYLGSYGLKDGKTDVRDFADDLPNIAHPEDPSIGKYLGKQTLRMLPDEGLYVKRVFDYLRLRDARDIAAEDCYGIGERMSEIEYQLEDPTGDQDRLDGLRAEWESLRDELDKESKKHEEAGAALEAHVGKDPTFSIVD